MEKRKKGRKVALVAGLALVVLSVAMVWTYWGPSAPALQVDVTELLRSSFSRVIVDRLRYNVSCPLLRERPRDEADELSLPFPKELGDMMFLRARRPLSVLLALMLGLALGCAGWAPRHEEEKPVPRSGTLSRAWIGPESVCLELLDRGILYYFEASSTQNTHGTESRPFGRTLRLRRVAKERWQERTAHLRPAAVAPSEEWARFRDLVARELIPPGVRRGVTISVGDRKIYVVSIGRRKDRALCLTEAPPGCEFIQHYDVSELKGLCVRAFPSWSGRPLGQCSPTVFQTGEQGSGAFPFVCVLPCEGDALTIAFEQKKPDPPQRWEEAGRRILSTLNLVSVLTYSHTISVINHPISAPKRLLLTLRDSVQDKLARVDLKLRKFPELERIPVPILSGESARMDLAAFEIYLDETLSVPPAPTTLRFLIDGREYFPRLKEAIEGARRSIHMRTYIFDNDDVALEIAKLLKKKSKKIDIRVLCDGLGSSVAAMAPPGSSPLEYQVIPSSMLSYLKDGSQVRVRHCSNTWLAGDHTKSTIIDGEIAFIGGMNIGREYRYEWHDMMVEISGPLVQELERQFKKAWADSGILGGFAALLFPGDQEKSEISESAGKSVRLLFTKPTKAEIYQAQLGAIRRSRGYIFLENAYFADDRILYELCAARKRGVDARVILTLKADSGLMNRNNVVVINTLLRHGVRVFLHPRMTHIKAAVFDGWACFGSANFDKLSLKINRELNLATSDPGVVQTLLDRLFYKDMDESIELVEPVPESWVDKFVEVIADEL